MVGGAVAYVARWDLRRRTRRLVFLALLVALVGAAVLAAASGARRSSTALERFKTSSRSADVELATSAGPRRLAELRRLPGVSAVGVLPAFGLVIPGAEDFQSVGAAVDDQFGRTVDRDRLVAGRRARPGAADEVTIGEGLANRLHLGVGDVIHAESFSPDQIAAILQGTADVGPRAGPDLSLRVVGIVRRPLDLGEQAASGGVLVLTPAFAREYGDRVGAFGYRVRLRTVDGTRDVPRVLAGARRVLGDDLFVAQSLAVESQGARNAIDVISVALWLAAAVVAVAGAVAIAIVLARETSTLGDVLDRTRELGATRRQRIRMAGASALVVAAAGGMLAVVGAIALSPAFPLGVARRADPDVGLHVDWVVAGIGFAAVVVVVTGIALVAAVRVTNPKRDADVRARPSTVAERVAAAGAPPPVANGVRLAFERGRGRTAVPVRSAVLGIVLGVVGVTAALVFSASLDGLVDTPARFGAPWDLQVADITSNTPCGGPAYGITDVPGVRGVTELCTQNVEVDGRPVTSMSYRRLTGEPVGATVLDGRPPRSAHEVALGGATLAALDKDVGDRVAVRTRSGARRFRIVGRAVFPTLAAAQPLDDGAAFTSAGYEPLFDQNLFQRFFVARFADGADRDRALARVAALPRLGVPLAPPVPVEIDRLQQVDWLPVTLTVLLGALALLAAGHGLVTGVRRRRRELALLKTLGFESGQVRATVAWQATSMAAVGVLLGVPVGLFLGVAVWRGVADGLGVDPGTVVPGLGVVAVVLAAVVLANLVAWWPARAAARTRASVALRAE
jgi:ABC-type lipoprotein release transport system permease subunit